MSGYNVGSLQENLIRNHNSILPTIYINYPWSMLWLRIYCASYPNVHALSSCPLLIYLMSYYSFTIYLPQGQHVIYMCPDIIPSTLLFISIIYAYTMYILWGNYAVNMFLNVTLSSKLFLILLDHSRPCDVMSCDFSVTCLLFLVIN